MLQSPADQIRSLSAVYLISFQLSSRCVAANTQFHARHVPVGLSLFTSKNAGDSAVRDRTKCDNSDRSPRPWPDRFIFCYLSLLAAASVS
jgi:hypothetical protein